MKAVIARKPGSELADRIAKEAIEILRRHGVETCDFPNCNPCESDFVVVIGGDGTLLYVASKTPCDTPPIITIRAGRRAFLLELEESEVEDGLKSFLEGRYSIEKHKRLRFGEFNAMNEIAVLSKGRRVTKLSVYSDGSKIYEGLEGDGLIISTTLGSTAYALSAGGPLIDPRLDAILIVPVNPIQLNVRPVVLPSTAEVTINIEYNLEEVDVLIDGIISTKAKNISSSLDGPYVTLARFKPRKFYERLIELRSL
ncbi:inorganic polyphosphate/ATP-NAD kinase [Ignicoccus islandicus DSM 13165]|uniref:NAD kinase n=1 Tax=Ignicoccus islandicus DSM 13165 TaxID=940295 RepID=A0A0U3FI98_9CREN|nr:NAD(+)/NADH kinase [Ignicoccus islandicus]ALU11622.1 inorganic polyphosphate/ATP-NAD kinase [Ignicoccus islandicus DSM 13165]